MLLIAKYNIRQNIHRTIETSDIIFNLLVFRFVSILFFLKMIKLGLGLGLVSDGIPSTIILRKYFSRRELLYDEQLQFD